MANNHDLRCAEIRATIGSLLDPNVSFIITVNETVLVPDSEDSWAPDRSDEKLFRRFWRRRYAAGGDGTQDMLDDIREIFGSYGVELLNVGDRHAYNPDGSYISDYATNEMREVVLSIEGGLSDEWAAAIYNAVQGAK